MNSAQKYSEKLAKDKNRRPPNYIRDSFGKLFATNKVITTTEAKNTTTITTTTTNTTSTTTTSLRSYRNTSNYVLYLRTSTEEILISSSSQNVKYSLVSLIYESFLVILT